jgi:hypothetical protein
VSKDLGVKSLLTSRREKFATYERVCRG